MSRNYSDDIIKAAYETWEVMHREAKKRGLALVKEKPHGDGRVLMGTISAFARGLNIEREWKLDETQIDMVRRYLKQSGNIVTLNKVADYQFRIFVREEWSNAAMVEAPVKKATKVTQSKSRDPNGTKLTPEEAGETREPAPVEHKCAECGKTFSVRLGLVGHMASHSTREPKKKKRRQDLTARQNRVLKALEQMGGEVTDPDGNCASKWAEAAGEDVRYISATQLRLKERGLLIREGKAKKTYRFALTEKGLREAKKLPEVELGAAQENPVEHKTVLYDPEKTKPITTIPDGLPITGNQSVDAELSSLIVRIAVELHLAKKAGDQQEKLDLIEEVIKEVNEGKLSPLKALGDIEATLRL